MTASASNPGPSGDTTRAGVNPNLRRIAIVNRGESGVRCLRAVKALRAREGSNLEVIALYTAPDRDTPYVRQADRAVELPSERGAVAAYLDHDRVIAGLKSCGADAVWPGWGFVAEDPIFVERLRAEGITFLGPAPEAMRGLGDKITSKQLAEKASVPVTAWSGGAIADEADALTQAERIGFPVVVKATAGGGGRGIRIVHERERLAEAFRSASAEALAAFGNGALFIEKLVSGGRHIEVQIAADTHGNAFSVGCRDCSVQRRHQKVLEEAPPPGLSKELLGELEGAAVRMVQHVGYVGVGTVEFLLAGNEFFFLEVNPRLQVEHGITEAITGVDLVEVQIRIARGESLAGLEIRQKGCSIEARVCAEDPDAGFLPSPGRVVRFDPSLGPRIRVDSGVAAGTVVSSDFDSLIAKVIATGDTREEAIARLSVALRDFELVVAGGATNKGYLLEILEAEPFRRGGVDTQWLDRWNADREVREQAEGGTASLEVAQDGLVAAAILAYQQNRAIARTNFYRDGTGALSAERIPPSQGQQIDLSHDGESYRLKVYATGSWRYRVHLDDVAVTALLREEGANGARLVIDDRDRRVLYDATDLGLRLELDGHPYRFGLQTAGMVRAGTPAMVVAVHVAVGDRVEAGQPLGLLEAMKMEIGFQAPVSGVVTEVLVHQGQQVAAGAVLLTIDSSGDEGEHGASRRLELPTQVDVLANLFRPGPESMLAQPDLERADRLELAERRRAIDVLREEIRRVLLGYDANPDRGQSLAAFLEAELPEQLSESFRRELAGMRHELTTFADIEQLFVRAPRASVGGETGPSNNARLRMYVRRMRAEGAGIASEFLDLVRRALAHYGVPGLEPTDALERAMLRLLACQRSSELRFALTLGIIKRVTALAEAGIFMGDDSALADALNRIARMRPQVSDTVADAALEASYVIFQQPGIESRAERSSSRVERWLAASETDLTVPPTGVLLEVAAAPRRVFSRVGRWLGGDDANRSAIALAAHVQRRYAPRAPLGYRAVSVGDTRMHCVEYPGIGVVLAATAKAAEVRELADKLCRAATGLRRRDPGTPLCALELLLPQGEAPDWEELVPHLERELGQRRPACRFTIGVLSNDGEEDVYKTFVPVSGGMVLRDDCLDLHPETAERIGLKRYAGFELERVRSEEGIYCFYGRSREVEGDDRVFVLADARDRSPEPGRELANHLASFERVFNRAARALRQLLQVRDPRRSLQWNRIAIFVAPPIYLDPEVAGEVARRLAPATRHLGLEKVLVRLNLLDRARPESPPKAMEIVIRDTGEQIDLGWREPHHEPLEPAQLYERKVVAARRRKVIYPYEIVRMLTGEQGNEARGTASAGSLGSALPAGRFEEFDLDPQSTSKAPLATSVAGRPYGHNKAAVVFGVIETPTEKHPEGMKRVLVLSDPTLGMGALAAPECDRLVAALDLAERLDVPVEWVPVSSGAKIAMDSGTENLDSTARVVRRIVTYTQAGGVIHIIVQGVNIGAQSYFDALATMLMHTRGILIMTQNASMVLTGRAALAAAGSVSAEDEVAIGGYERIMGPNGESQYFAHNLPEAYRILYEHYRYAYVAPGESGPRKLESADPAARSICEWPLPAEQAFDFATVGEIFDDATNPGRKRPFSMRAVMAATIDQDGGYLERWSAMVGGETAIVWDAHLGGHPIEIIGIESHSVDRDGYRPADGPESWSGGTLFPLSSKKVARAINAASGNRPVVILANLSGFDGSPESLRKLQLEYGAEIARAVVNFEGPLLFSVVSRYHGGAYVVFSQELNPGLKASALEGSFASVIGGGPAAAVVFAREVRAQAVADPRVAQQSEKARREPSEANREALEATLTKVTLEKQAEVAAEFDRIHSVQRAKEVGSLSSIIPADGLRASLIAALEARNQAS